MLKSFTRVKPVLKPERTIAVKQDTVFLCSKITAMKTRIFLLFLASAAVLPGCDDDPFPLELTRFDAYWVDLDGSGTRTPNDRIDFDIRAATTDPNTDDQFITDFEFSYRVNGDFVGVIQSDTRMETNELNVDISALIKNLQLPFTGGLRPGDEFEFRFWAVDNHGTTIERYYTFRLE